MQKSSEASVTTAVRSLDSKVVVITPKQLAELGIDKDIKRVYRSVRKGDGALTAKQPVSGGLLNTLRARINVLLSEQSVVSDTKPEVCENQKLAESEVKNSRKKDIVILSNKAVHYSESEMQAMLKSSQPHVINGIVDVKSTIRGTEAQQKSKSPNFVPDRTPEKPAAEEVLSCDTKSPAETTRSPSTKQSTVPWNQLIPSTFANRFNVVKTYSKVNVISIVQKETPIQTPPSAKKLSARIIKTPSAKMDGAKSKEAAKAKPEPKTKESSKPKEEAKPKPEAKEPMAGKGDSKPKPEAKEPVAKGDSKPKPEAKEPVAKEDPKPKEAKSKEESKTKDEEEPVTPVVPKKRGRPRKTPLQPKVDEDSEPELKPEKPKKEVKETPKADQTNPTPRRRGRPRKVQVEPKPEEISSDEDSPVEKKRRPMKKTETKEKGSLTPSTGTRTSGRKRKVVDYAALSGGRISSSEEEDFAEILAQEELNKKKTKEDKVDKEDKEDDEDMDDNDDNEENDDEDKEDKEDSVDEVEEEKIEDTKVVKSPKIEAVHPLKKRLKMEHAQAIEKEKLDEKKVKEEKDKNGEGEAPEKEEKMDTTEKIEEKESKEEPEKPSEEKSKPSEEKSKSSEEKLKPSGENSKPSEEKSEGPKKSELVSENSTNKVNDKASKDEPESKTNKTSEKEKPSEPVAEKKAEPDVEKSSEEDKTSEDEKVTDEEKATEESTEEVAPVKEESAPKEIKCGVCDETVDSEASWAKHKVAQHNDLAWKVGEKPLELPQREAQSQM